MYHSYGGKAFAKNKVCATFPKDESHICILEVGEVSFPHLGEAIPIQFRRGFSSQKVWGVFLFGFFFSYDSRFFTIRVWGMFTKCNALSGAEDKAIPSDMAAAEASPMANYFILAFL